MLGAHFSGLIQVNVSDARRAGPAGGARCAQYTVTLAHVGTLNE
ncbi:hypothetical protein BURMUCF1_A1100 [Burkholderia multivorans ATCC BAA-247]|uniref:Uncharacterized protein n=1 Tax=Burkholderia multivorans CGD2 TaxID=513052 RepID=B9BJ49_9BURK|nr:hypothetical protein BURMUCGD2_5105 [Burkholderia multivorans CGD2]EEE15655.1 hypothetical protein BURMUCGD2M_5098 [Burkholderia multivorans CGD2M]EJO56329.1 hypothetical protein BURMUCF1_A1100 [Burkholderia multivorans ATCC BAA-247]